MTDQTFSRPRPRQPLVLSILAILGFTAFAIPVSIIAMSEFGALGLALAAFLAWQWTRLAGIGGAPSVDEIARRLGPQTAEVPAGSGNASFDAYRGELMARLETEQANFEGFLTRLRAAKDQTEFDGFMAERERRTAASGEALPA
ncbi:MAG: DUF2852 domain-containing protein [Paracoccaceae bacterium]|nr:DUF2852 domain-containing protein [Paracoccaceae bacterium]